MIKVKKKVLASKVGSMEQFLSVCGKKIRLMDWVGSSLLMVISTKVTGKKTKQMELEHIYNAM